MRHISKFCAGGNDVVTPVDIVRALRANGGLCNSVVEMVSMNRRKIDAFTNDNFATIKRMSFVRSHFEVQYNNSLNRIESYSYSGIGDGLICSLSNEDDEEDSGEQIEAEQEDQEPGQPSEQTETREAAEREKKEGLAGHHLPERSSQAGPGSHGWPRLRDWRPTPSVQ